MDYIWNPDMVLHIIDPWFEQLPCQGRILSKNESVLRCSRYRSDKYYVKARQLLATLSREPPSHVSTKQLKTLAHLCLCADHQDDEAIIVQELENRLQEARRSYLTFETIDTRFSTFQKNICDKLGIDEDQSDAGLVDTIQNLHSNVSSREHDIAGLRGKLWAEQNIRKAVESEMKEHKKTVQSLQSRFKELEIELKDSESKVVQLEKSLEDSKKSGRRVEESLESAEAQVRRLEESCERSEAKARQQDAELSRLKFESVDKEMSNQELKTSITNLKALETTLQCRVKELQEAILQTQAQARDLEQSNASRQEQLTSTEQRLSEQIRALSMLHEQNSSLAEKFATTTHELQKCQNQLVDATTTISHLELTNTALQRRIDEERARADTAASKTWRAWIRNFTQKRSEAAQQQHEANSPMNVMTTTMIPSPDA